PALAHAQEALRIATAIEHQQWIVVTYGALGQLYLSMLEPALAISALEAGLAGAQTLGSAYWIGNLRSYLALAYVLRREFTRAEEVEARRALKRREEAARVLEDAILGAEQRQAPSVLWRVHGSLGQVYHMLKRADQAQREWSEACEIIAKLAETIDQTYLREHFVQAALQTLQS